MIKLSRVLKVEVGGPSDFAKLGSKEAILAKLQEKAGPEARKLFEQFMRLAGAARTERRLAAMVVPGQLSRVLKVEVGRAGQAHS